MNSSRTSDLPFPRPLKFRILSGASAIVRFAADASIPEWANRGEFTSITRSTDELSIVCPAENVPEDLNSGPRWVCLKLEGPFAFSETGVLHSFLDPLAHNGIPILAISTYDTDYVLVQEDLLAKTREILGRAGHEFLGSGNTSGVNG